MVVTGALTGMWSGRAAASVDPGTGTSYAQAMQVTPHEGSLAVGGVFDEALAGHTDQIARAQSQGLDLGAVGTSIKGYNCGQPPTKLADYVPSPLEAETPSSGGTTEQSVGPSPSDNNSDGSVEHVVASGTPYGEADTTFGGKLAAPGNAVTIAEMASKAWSGLVNGSREAGATVDIGSVDIAGVVALTGLHWASVYPSGPGALPPTGTFSIAKAAVNGQSIPTGDLSTVAAAVNQALAPLGIQLAFPSGTTAQGIQFESPLQIEVVPSDTRDQVTDPVISGGVEQNFYPVANGLENGFASTSPPYNALAPTESGPPGSPQQQLQTALCQSDTPITVLDITIASFTAGGFFNIGLGGVNATSADLAANPYNLSAFSPFSLPGSTQVIPGTPGTAGSAAVGAGSAPSAGPAPSTAASPTALGGSTGASPQPAGAPGGTQQYSPASTSPAATIMRTASGPLLAVGFGVLGLLAVLAEADRRVIRRTVHKAAFQE